MPDGIYTSQGWQPLPAALEEKCAMRHTPGSKILLAAGGLCLLALMVFLALTGLFAPQKG